MVRVANGGMQTPVRQAEKQSPKEGTLQDRGPGHLQHEYWINFFGKPSKITLGPGEAELTNMEKMTRVHLGIDAWGDHIDMKLATEGENAYVHTLMPNEIVARIIDILSINVASIYLLLQGFK